MQLKQNAAAPKAFSTALKTMRQTQKSPLARAFLKVFELRFKLSWHDDFVVLYLLEDQLLITPVYHAGFIG